MSSGCQDQNRSWERRQSRPQHLDRKVFIFHLPYSVTSRELHEIFSSCGEISDVLVRNDRNDRKFGILIFTSAESVESALKLNGTTIRGHEIEVQLPKELIEDDSDRPETRQAERRTQNPRINRRKVHDSSKGVNEESYVEGEEDSFQKLSLGVSRTEDSLSELNTTTDVLLDRVNALMDEHHSLNQRLKAFAEMMDSQMSRARQMQDQAVEQVESQVRRRILSTLSPFLSDLLTGSDAETAQAFGDALAQEEITPVERTGDILEPTREVFERTMSAGVPFKEGVKVRVLQSGWSWRERVLVRAQVELLSEEAGGEGLREDGSNG